MPKAPSDPGKLRVAELFAGVGGFRVGLERAGGFQVVWSNQWEPGKKRQHASDTYVRRFGAGQHVGADIATVKVADIPEHDLLVGGFPCQDYSVASTLNRSHGLVGKKGVLWWQIHRILEGSAKPPRYLLLENVDRLLGSPAGQRGRDFAIMLASLSALGYRVEWRVVNAADHGMPQRRKRVFIFGERSAGKALSKAAAERLLLSDGLLATAFKAEARGAVDHFQLDTDLALLSQEFGTGKARSPFAHAGVMHRGQVYTVPVRAVPEPPAVLGDVLVAEEEVPETFFIPPEQLDRWRYLKGAKREERTTADGSHTYRYAEGAMVFPDDPQRPSRTIITGEGGPGPSRFKHVVLTPSGRYRRLVPVELERLNMFPDGHTEGASDAWRAFFMGNALVTGIVERIGKQLAARHVQG